MSMASPAQGTRLSVRRTRTLRQEAELTGRLVRVSEGTTIIEVRKEDAISRVTVVRKNSAVAS